MSDEVRKEGVFRESRKGLRVEVRPLDDLDLDDLKRWRRLADDALEANPFQQPEFALPVAADRPDRESIRLLLALDDESGEWLGVLVCQELRPSLVNPLRRLRVLESPYSFLDAPLIDRIRAPEVARAWLSHLSSQRTWHSLELRTLRRTSELQTVLDEAAAAGGQSRIAGRMWNRPEVDLRILKGEPLLSFCSRSRRKSLLRARRWLEARGSVTYQLKRPESGDMEPVETFLRLESLGWKGAQGTALASSEADHRFFVGMIQGFAKRREAVFGELAVDGQVIASTCNLQAGQTLFAFKIGWDPEFAPGNPGHWSELELVSALQGEESDLVRIDGCCPADAYTASVYPHAYPAGGVAYTWSWRGALLWSARMRIRGLKRSWQARRSAAAAPPPSESDDDASGAQ